MENELFQALLANTYTQSGLKKLIKNLEYYLNQKLFGGSGISESAGQLKPTGLLKPELLDKITAQDFETILKQLKKLADQMPVLIINVPIDLPSEEINKLGQSLRTTYPNLLIEIKIDPQLIAGCSLIYKGVIKDYSLRQKIEENKAQLTASFKGYLR